MAAAAPAVTYVVEERVDEVVGLPGTQVVVGRGMGARLSPGASAPAGGVQVFADEVLAFADDYDDPVVDAETAAWFEPPLTQAELLRRADGWPRAGRVLTTLSAGDLEGATAVLGAVAREGSLVLVRTEEPEADPTLGRINVDERVTHTQIRGGSPQPV